LDSIVDVSQLTKPFIKKILAQTKIQI
jgi:hypothetical protein